jgi:hypothetical protein
MKPLAIPEKGHDPACLGSVILDRWDHFRIQNLLSLCIGFTRCFQQKRLSFLDNCQEIPQSSARGLGRESHNKADNTSSRVGRERKNGKIFYTKIRQKNIYTPSWITGGG